MKSVYDTRRVNLRALINQWGGPTSLSRKLGHSNGSYIAQIAGPHPSREISEKVAREVESKLGLPIGWLDQDHPGGATQLNDQALSDCVKAVATVLRDAGLRPDPETYASLVQLTYDRAKLLGRIDEQHIKKLTDLVRGSGK
jgi:hypothetical protein